MFLKYLLQLFSGKNDITNFQYVSKYIYLNMSANMNSNAIKEYKK